MGQIPGWLLRFTADIEPLIGQGSHGPVYGPMVTERCFREDGRKLVRAKDGSEVVSSTTLWFRLSVVCPEGSRVTLPGRVSTAIASIPRDGGGLATPDHLEVALA